MAAQSKETTPVRLHDTYTESMRGVTSGVPAPKAETPAHDVDSSSMRGFVSFQPPVVR